MSTTEDDSYWAFISYSHTDQAVADWLHKALETYRIPSKLVGTTHRGQQVPKRLYPVFRDRDELPSSESLADKVNDALSRSRSLIVIASRQSARSRWVNEEIRAYKAMGRGDHILCIIVDGEPHAASHGDKQQECFAPALRFELDTEGQISAEPAEPVAADIRPGQDKKHDALLKLVAGVLGLGLDALRQRDLHRRYRTLMGVAVASVMAAAFTSALSVLALQARDEARAQRAVADARRNQAEELIDFVLGDLRRKLEPIGKLDILDTLSEEALRYFRHVEPEMLTDRELAVRGKALRQMGELRANQGRLDESSPMFHEALKIDQEQIRRHPADTETIFNVAQSQFYIAYELFLRRDYESAEPWFIQYLSSSERLLDIEPQVLRWQQEKQYALDNLATNHLRLGNFAQCIEFSTQAGDLVEDMLKRDPRNEIALASHATSLTKRSLCLENIGHLDKAISSLIKAERLSRELAERHAQNYEYKFRLAVTSSILGQNLLIANRTEAAEGMLNQSVELYGRLLKQDPSNAKWRSLSIAPRIARAQFILLKGNSAGALKEIRSAREVLSTDSDSSFDPKRRKMAAAELDALELAAHIFSGDLSKQVMAANQLAATLTTVAVTNETSPASLALTCALLARFAEKHLVESTSTCEKINPMPVENPMAALAMFVQAMREQGSITAKSDRSASRQIERYGYRNALWEIWQKQPERDQ